MEMTQIPVIDQFRGEYAFLSNFYSSPLTVEDVTYPTVEHAFQAAKCYDSDQMAVIASAATPKSAKALGRMVGLREDWEDVKVAVMANLLELKFTTYPHLARQLRHTGEAELIEGNWWHDQFWGNCQCQHHRLVPGHNQLGTLLMARRELL